MRKKSRVNFLMNRHLNLDSIVRVNHAGEFGAVRIYSAQSRIFQGTAFFDEIEKMKTQEIEHLQFFESEMIRGEVSPTVFLPLWSVLGYILGYITARCGIESAMLCTAAIEEVIDCHYSRQVRLLGDCRLSQKIEKFRLEEVDHQNIANGYNNGDTFTNLMLSHAIKLGCRVAIFLSERI